MTTTTRTIDNILSVTAADLTNRAKSPDAAVTAILNYFKPDLYSRNPSPAMCDIGLMKPTDLDLSSFMLALADRGAVISIPQYKAKGPKSLASKQERHIGNNRFGKLHGLTANKEVFSFSARIFDASVVKTETVGATRNFLLTNSDGSWYPGWKRIEFQPNVAENDWITDKNLWTGQSIIFKNFVHPNRWVSFFGRPYLLAKIAIDRLSDEASWLYQEMKKLKAPLSPVMEFAGDRDNVEENTKSVNVQAFEAEVESDFFGKYKHVGRTKLDKLQHAEARRKFVLFNLIPALRFVTRSIELAFSNTLQGTALCERRPAWVAGVFEDFKAPKARNVWRRISLNGLVLKYRLWKKTERVNV